MRIVFYLLALILSLVGAAGFFISRYKIIIFYPRAHKTLLDKALSCADTVVCTLYHHDAIITEEFIVPYQAARQDNMRIQSILNNLMGCMISHDVILTNAEVQSVLIDHKAKIVYLSFNKNIFSLNQSIRQKWLIIESILKTIRDATCSLQNVYFLVNHAPMADDHLSLSAAWPLEGFRV